MNFLFGCWCSSIRLWALTGEVLLEMVGHTSIVYSVDSHVSGLIVSGSEDCFAKIWKGKCSPSKTRGCFNLQCFFLGVGVHSIIIVILFHSVITS